MIKRVELTNFQSHPNTVLPFHPGVNVIVGASDSGKTAILRAMRWAIWNRPTGDSFRSSWGGATTVKITTEELDDVARARTDKENSYWLQADELKAFGADVPEEIQKALNINEINFQQQLDRPFLLDDNPGAVAAHFNRIAHLDRIDNSTALVKKWTTALNQQIRDGQRQMIQLTETLEKYGNLDRIEKEIEEAEALLRRLEDARRKRAELYILEQEWRRIETALSRYAETMRLAPVVTQALSWTAELVEVQAQHAAFTRVTTQYRQLEARIQEQKQILRVRDLVELGLTQFRALWDKQQLHKAFARIADQFTLTNTKIQVSQRVIAAHEKEFQAEMGDQCPLCGQEIK